MTEAKVISKRSERGVSTMEIMAEIADAPDLQGVVDPHDLKAPSGEVERPEDERLMRRIALALLDARLTEDIRGGDIATVKKALDKAGVPLAMYEQAVQNERFQAIQDEMHRCYVLTPRSTSVMLALAKRAMTGEAAAVNAFMRLSHGQDEALMDEVRKLQAQGGDANLIRVADDIVRRIEQIKRDLDRRIDMDAERAEAVKRMSTFDEAGDGTPTVDHKSLYSKEGRDPERSGSGL